MGDASFRSYVKGQGPVGTSQIDPSIMKAKFSRYTGQRAFRRSRVGGGLASTSFREIRGGSMFAVQNCPRCQLKINNDRLRSFPIICDCCGHVLSANQIVVEEKMERSFLYSIIGFSASLVLGFMLVANWGNHSVEAVFFQVGEILGSHAPQDYEHMGEVCLSLKKYDCVEKMYFEVARADSRQFARLGRFQVAQHKYKEAADSFRRYFANGHGDIEVNYFYAKALGETGRIDEAAKHFEYVLAARPRVMQVTVVQNYVKYLVAANRLEQAQKVIQKMRSRDQTVSSFMDSELKEIRQKMGRRQPPA